MEVQLPFWKPIREIAGLVATVGGALLAFEGGTKSGNGRYLLAVVLAAILWAVLSARERDAHQAERDQILRSTFGMAEDELLAHGASKERIDAIILDPEVRQYFAEKINRQAAEFFS